MRLQLQVLTHRRSEGIQKNLMSSFLLTKANHFTVLLLLSLFEKLALRRSYNSVLLDQPGPAKRSVDIIYGVTSTVLSCGKFNFNSTATVTNCHQLAAGQLLRYLKL